MFRGARSNPDFLRRALGDRSDPDVVLAQSELSSTARANEFNYGYDIFGNEVDEVLEILIGFNEQGMTIIMIEHIMRAVMHFSQRVICLDAGELIAEGKPDEIVKDKGVERAYLGV